MFRTDELHLHLKKWGGNIKHLISWTIIIIIIVFILITQL